MSQKHLFSFFYPYLEQRGQVETIVITDDQLIHRISRVLRMKKGDCCILFNARVHAYVKIIAKEVQTITVQVRLWKSNKVVVTPLTLVLPILKREALYKAVYGATEMGVDTIQLTITAHSRTSLLPHENKRLRKAIIAASEQSKHFSMATLYDPIPLKDYYKTIKHQQAVVADPSGGSIVQLLSYQATDVLHMYVGPEGDFNQEEKSMFKEHGALLCKLTPTVLQSYQAAILLTGLCTSLSA